MQSVPLVLRKIRAVGIRDVDRSTRLFPTLGYIKRSDGALKSKAINASLCTLMNNDTKIVRTLNQFTKF